MAKRNTLELVKPEIIRTITWNGEKWVNKDGTEATIDPVREFEIVDENVPELVHYICKYGYRISEEDNKLAAERIGYNEYKRYEKESSSFMA